MNLIQQGLSIFGFLFMLLPIVMLPLSISIVSCGTLIVQRLLQRKPLTKVHYIWTIANSTILLILLWLLSNISFH